MAAGELFISENYLTPLHRSGSASPQTGWHRLADSAAPLYLKDHSWGEFVFDFAFAQAYQEHGLDYYPKLVCAVPFTPVVGPRMAGGLTAEQLQQQCLASGASSVHVLFLPPDEAKTLAEAGWHRRDDLRFVWRNRDYADFDAFLAALASKKRKNIRAERRKVAALGLDIRWQSAGEFSPAEWGQLYQLYASTYAMRGQAPYLTQDCLLQWAEGLADEFVFCVARGEGDIQAMAFYFREADRLYGRHWGARADFDALHFELCYYRGIEYCITHGLEVFDAGVQGGHRLLRGFEPQRTQSAHWFAEPRFHHAIGDYLQRERHMLQSRMASLEGQTAFARR